MFWQKEKKAGLDLGGYSLKWAGVEVHKGICHVASRELLPGRASHKEVVEDSLLSLRLEALKQAAAIWPKKVAVGFSGVGVSCGYLELPALSAKELRLAIPSAVLKQIPHRLDEVELLGWPVPVLGSEAAQGYFYATLPRASGERLRRLVAALGLELDSLEASAVALARAFHRNHDLERAYALVDCGFSATRVVLARQGSPYFWREFPLAGSHFTYAVQMGDQVSWAEAEKIKLDYDVGRLREHKLEPYVLSWLQQVQHSLDFGREQRPELEVDSVYLSGGSSAWMGLERRLEEKLERPVLKDDWSRLRPTTPGQHSAGLYNIALGLALRP